jgi:hypothetical protein
MIDSDEILNMVIGIITLIIFLLIVYPFSMMLLTDLSPENNKIFAVVNFPNCFTILNIYRVIISIMNSTDNGHFIIIPTILFMVLTFFGLISFPFLTWRYN